MSLQVTSYLPGGGEVPEVGEEAAGQEEAGELEDRTGGGAAGQEEAGEYAAL